jgi:VWFA-related protein
MGPEARLSRRSLLSALALFPAARRLRGQQESPKDATFSTDVKVVSLFANVRNKQGQIVRDLTKDDFLLDEDGRPQTIRYFVRETDLPLTLGLLVDTSGSVRRVLPDERSASYRFLEQVLREDKDLAFLIHFDFEVELLQDLTNSRKKLEKALDELQVASPRQWQTGQQGGGSGGGNPGSGGRPPVGIGLPGGIGFPGGGRRGRNYPRGGGQPGGGQRRGGGTSLYDAVMLAADELMKKQRGRKALILLTDGVDNGSKVTLADAVESAQRADTLVYSILFEDPEAMGHGGFGGMGRRPGMGGGQAVDGKKILERISRETGGRFFEVSKKQPIDKVYADIEEDLRNQYSLGYSPEGTNDSRAYRRIHLATRQKGLIVQTREGYYPV